jgi:hypothetical protein
MSLFQQHFSPWAGGGGGGVQRGKCCAALVQGLPVPQTMRFTSASNEGSTAPPHPATYLQTADPDNQCNSRPNP